MISKLIDIYRDSFDITENYIIDDVIYDAYGFCNITNSKYVLTKKAELWRALCFEHIFFKSVEKLEEDDVENFRGQVEKFIEPQLVRKGETCTPKNHMYSYITCVFVCNGLTPDAELAIKRTKFFRNYMFTVRGYCELRIVAVDLSKKNVTGNSAAKDLVKDYKKYILK